MRELALLLMMSVASPSLRIEATPRGDTFTWQATDVHGAASNIATVIALPTVAGPRSDRFIATDVDGDAMIYRIVTQARHGVVEITNAATGEFIYTPHENVTLTPANTDPAITYTLQRSLDLVTWADLAPFLPGMSLHDRRISAKQFYRLKWQQGAAPTQSRLRVIIP